MSRNLKMFNLLIDTLFLHFWNKNSVNVFMASHLIAKKNWKAISNMPRSWGLFLTKLGKANLKTVKSALSANTD